MSGLVSACTRCGGRLVPYDDSGAHDPVKRPGPLLRLYRRVARDRRSRLIATTGALAIALGLVAFALAKRPELNPVAAEAPVPISVAQPIIATVTSLDIPLPTRASTPTVRTATPAAPNPNTAPRADQPPPTPPASVPQPAPVSDPTFAVNTLPINCHSQPATNSGVVNRKPANAVQQLTMVAGMDDGTWHFDGAKKCWIKTNPGPVRLFSTKAEADAFVRSNKPPPTQDPRVKAFIDSLDALTTRYAAAAEQARAVVARPSITDSGWRLRYRDAWLAVVPSAAEVKALKPQPCHKESHAAFQAAAASLNLASSNAMRGMETVDADLLEQAITQLDEGIRGLAAATEAARSAYCA